MKQSGAGLAALSGLDDPVRYRLYEVVCARTEPVGRDEAAAAAGIGRALAAYHLDKLVALGLLIASYQRPSGRAGPGAGRPAKLYARSAGEFAVSVPAREYELAARLLAMAVEADCSGASRLALQAAARQLGAVLGQCGQTGAGPHDPRQAMEAALRANGFEPRTGDDGSIRLRNCPFRQLAAQHTEIICGMNLALIEGMAAGLDALALQPALDPRPGCCCVVIGASQLA